MSLLHVIDEAVRMCKAEESRLTENIRQCREILCSMKTRVPDISELKPAADINPKDDILPEEKQEIELLDQVLKKALKIRSTSEAQKDLWSDIGTRPKNSRNKSAIIDAVKDEDNRNHVKSVSSESSRKVNHRVRSAGGSVTRGALGTRTVLPRKGSSARPIVTVKQPAQKSASMKISPTGSQQKISVKTINAEEPSEDHFTSLSYQPLCEDVSNKDQESTEQWIPSPLLPVWRSQRAKQNRLWNKVLTHQSKPVPERTHFTERLRSTFPSEWPSGCPAYIRTELDVLTQRCLDLTHCFHAELQAVQSRPAGSEPGASGERRYESSLMLKGLERMTEGLLTCANRQKKDWERWNKFHSETLCPIRRKWGDPDCASLPPMLSYTSETELRRLESQRLRVEHLQQAVSLQQVMSDNLSSYWTSMDSGTAQPSAVVLRGLYSLLAEGGLQFPSLVLDSE